MAASVGVKGLGGGGCVVAWYGRVNLCDADIGLSVGLAVVVRGGGGVVSLAVLRVRRAVRGALGNRRVRRRCAAPEARGTR